MPVTKKLAVCLAWCLTFGGGLALSAGALYATWLFWTDPSWAFAKVIAVVFVSGPVLALVAHGLFRYAARSSIDG